MKKWLKILLSLNSLRKSLGYGNFFAANKFNFHIEVLEDLKFKKVLVLAPHPDDDSFGCGGAIKKLSSNNAQIAVAYFCDGSGGVKEEDVELKSKNVELINIRKKEAKQTAEILGINEQIFFDYPDGKLAPSKTVNRLLSDLIKRFEPDIIFVPSFLDNHPDHRAVNEILVNVLVASFSPSTPLRTNFFWPKEIWAYEVWTPLYANRIVQINNEIEAKKSSMKAHASQLASRGYDEAMLGLNKYRAQINNRQGYAEAFFASTPAIYEKLYRKS
jgi:LmbE family N-acetylglucosaminyl deacetylase